MNSAEQTMRTILDMGLWPTAKLLNWADPSRAFGRELNGRECKLRERLAAEYGWSRVRYGLVTRWERNG